MATAGSNTSPTPGPSNMDMFYEESDVKPILPTPPAVGVVQRMENFLTSCRTNEATFFQKISNKELIISEKKVIYQNIHMQYFIAGKTKRKVVDVYWKIYAEKAQDLSVQNFEIIENQIGLNFGNYGMPYFTTFYDPDYALLRAPTEIGIPHDDISMEIRWFKRTINLTGISEIFFQIQVQCNIDENQAIPIVPSDFIPASATTAIFTGSTSPTGSAYGSLQQAQLPQAQFHNVTNNCNDNRVQNFELQRLLVHDKCPWLRSIVNRGTLIGTLNMNAFDVEDFLRYVYLDAMFSLPRHLDELCVVTDILRVHGLKGVVEHFIMKTMNAANLFDYFVLGQLMESDEIKLKCIETLQAHKRDLFTSEVDFQETCTDFPELMYQAWSL